MSKTDKIKAIITGSTGMVGEGVLHEALQNPQVGKVLIINRKSLGVTHPKLTEIIHPDFYDLSAIEGQLAGYNACYFCLGISSVGVNETDYYKTTYMLTMGFANMVSALNNDMTFCYISGAGTDSTEKGRSMWARIKGKTENDVLKLSFKQAFAVRPGFIKPIKGLTRINPLYKFIGWMFPLGRAMYPAGFVTLQELAAAMFNVTLNGYSKNILEGKDLIELAKQ